MKYLIIYFKHNGLFWIQDYSRKDSLDKVNEFLSRTDIKKVKVFEAKEIKIKLTVEDSND